jgi:hypothetical protein
MSTYHRNIIWARWIIIISLWLFWCFGRTYYLRLQDGTWFRQMTMCCSGQFPQRTLHNWHIVFHHMSNSLTWKLEALCSHEMSKQTSTLQGTNTQKMTLYEPRFAYQLTWKPQNIQNKFTHTSEDVHSSKRPAIYISFGPFQPLSSLQSHDHVAGSSTQTCIMIESIKTGATSLLCLSGWSTKLPSLRRVFFEKMTVAHLIKKLHAFYRMPRLTTTMFPAACHLALS